MANAVKRVSVQRGHDVTQYTLACFGGAGGQHACLGGRRTWHDERLHPSVRGVVRPTAWGSPTSGDPRESDRGREWRKRRSPDSRGLDTLARSATQEVLSQGAPPERIELRKRAHLRYEGTDTALITPFGGIADMRRDFEMAYKRRFSFLMPSREIIVEAISVEAIGKSDAFTETPPIWTRKKRASAAIAAEFVEMTTGGKTHYTPVFCARS